MADLFEKDNNYEELKNLILQGGPVRSTPKPQARTVSPINSPEQEDALAEMFTQIHQQKEPTLITPIQLGALGNLKAGLKASAYSELDTLDLLSNWISKVTGLPKGGIFESLKGKVKPEDWEMDDKSFGATLLRTIGMVPIPLGEALVAMTGVGAIPVIGKAALKVGGKKGLQVLGETGVKKLAEEAAIKAAETGTRAGVKGLIPLAAPLAFGGLGAGKAAIHGGSPLEIAEEAGKGAALGTGLGLLHPFGLPARVAGNAGLFGGMTAIEPGVTKEDVGAQTVVGGLLGLMGGRSKKPTEQPPVEIPPTRMPPGEPAGPPSPEMGRVMPWDVPARGERPFYGPPGPEPGVFEQKPSAFPETERVVFSDIEPRPVPKGTTVAKASPEAQSAAIGNLVDYLVNKGYRRDVIESVDPGMLDWMVGKKKSPSGKVYYKTTDPEKLAIRTYEDKEGETQKVIYKREGRFRNPASFPNDAALINEMETAVSLSRYNKLMTELKSRGDKEAQGNVDTESLMKLIAENEGIQVPGAVETPESSVSPVRFQQAAQSIMSEYPDKVVTTKEFLKIAAERYSIPPEDRTRLAAIVMGEGWKIKGSGETLDTLVGRKAEEMFKDRAQKTTIEEKAKNAVANEEPIPAEWDKLQEKPINDAIKEKLIPSREKFELLDFDEKSEVIDNLDYIADLRGQMAAERLSKEGLTKKSEHDFKVDIGKFKSTITNIFKISERFAKEKSTDEIEKIGGPFNKGDKITLAGKNYKGIVQWSDAKETSVAIKEPGKEIGYMVIPNEELTPLNLNPGRIVSTKEPQYPTNLMKGEGKQLQPEGAKLLWNEYLKEQEPFKKQSLKEKIEGFLGLKDKETLTNEEFEQRLGIVGKETLTKGEVAVVSPEAEQIAAEVAWMKESLAHHGEKTVNALTKAFEKYRNAGLGTEEAVIKARKDAKFKPKSKSVVEQLAKAEEIAAEGKGVTPEKAKEIAIEEVSNQVKFEYDKIKDLIGEKYADEFLKLRQAGLSLEEASIRVKGIRSKDRSASRTIIKTKDGKERTVGAKAATEFVEQVKSEADRITQMAIEKGADPEIAKELMKGETITPQPEATVLPRPKGTEDLPNPNEVLLMATTQLPKVAEGLPKIKAKINRLQIKLDETTRAAKILSEKRDSSAGNVELYHELQEKLAAQRSLRNNIVNELEITMPLRL